MGITDEIPLNELETFLNKTDQPAQPPRPTKQKIVHKGYTAKSLLETDFPEPNWVIPGILCEGLSLLCGPPKMGKSWLCLGWGIAIAAGGKAFGTMDVNKGEVLYLALEDTPRRLKKRLQTTLQGDPAPDGFHIYTDWPKMDSKDNGLIYLKKFLLEHPCKLIIIDTLAKVRRRVKGNSNAYADDYEAIEGLKALADTHGIAVVIVHHLRKGVSDDPLEQISGTTGLTGAADSLIILKRERGQADGTLFITGRDVEEKELALAFDQQICTWKIMGQASDYRMSKERLEIVALLRSTNEPLKPQEIADTLDKKPGTIRKLLISLCNEGIVKKANYGRYIIGNSSNSSNYGNSSNSGNSREYVTGSVTGNSEVLPKVLPVQNQESHVAQGIQKSVTSVTGVTREPTLKEVQSLFGYDD